jgi:hypothetical protein
MKTPNKKTIAVIAVIIFIIALVLLFLQAATTVTVKYGTPAEHGSSYK